MDISTLSDDELFGKVAALAETERFCLADFLLHLGELDRRPACEKRGYASTFAYLTRGLGYSESDAIRRVRASRAAREFPSILRMLAQGEVHLVAVSMLQPLLTSRNHEILLRKACRRTTRELERLVADMLPAAPEPRDRVRALPPLAPAAPAAVEAAPGVELPGLDPCPSEPPAVPAKAEPRVALTFSAPEEIQGLLEEARDYLRHKFPLGRMEEVIGEALRRFVEQERAERSRAARISSRPGRKSRRIPRSVKAEVWRRDGGRCAFVGSGGLRCGERAWIEFDHVRPWALGGASDAASNVRLLCRSHNKSEAERLLG